MGKYWFILVTGIYFGVYSNILRKKSEKHTTKEYDEMLNDHKRLFDPPIEKYLTDQGKLIQEKAQKKLWFAFAFFFASLILSIIFPNPFTP